MLLPNQENNSVFLKTVLIFALSTMLLYLLSPHIGVTDVDAYAYITGAYSIQAGKGYVDLNGVHMNHWPPGYSFFLSLFPNPLQASLLINYVALFIAVTILYILSRKNGWNWLIAISFCLVIEFGFFRGMTKFAKADILTYAFFLLAVLFYLSSNRALHFISYLIWNALIPLKLIAVVFTPSAIICQLIENQKNIFNKREIIEITIAVISWLVSLITILLFNYYTINSIIPSSHGETEFSSFTHRILQFFSSILRDLLTNWYSSIRDYRILLPICLTLGVGFLCIASLRIVSQGKQIRNLGLLIIALSWVLILFKDFYADMRLMGYGLIILIISFLPRNETNKRWLVYALLSIFLALINIHHVNSFGANDTRYQKLANDLKSVQLPHNQTIFTNTFHILDIHIKVPTQPVENINLLHKGSYFLWVNLPNYDAIASTVWAMDRPAKDWCEVISVDGAQLFRKCK